MAGGDYYKTYVPYGSERRGMETGMRYKSLEDVEENLRDAGFGEEAAAEFINCVAEGDVNRQLKLCLLYTSICSVQPYKHAYNVWRLCAAFYCVQYFPVQKENI